MTNTTLSRLLKISHPIIQAPMAGITTPELVAAVSQHGALGSLAVAAQMGTAFLTCEESSAHPAYKQKILQSKKEETALTCAFSGKAARGILNRFMKEMAPYENQLPDYPVQHYLTQKIRQKAAQQNSADLMSLWAGQNVHLARASSARQLIRTLMQEYSSRV